MMGDDEIATLDLFSGIYDVEISFSDVMYVARDSVSVYYSILWVSLVELTVPKPNHCAIFRKAS